MNTNQYIQYLINNGIWSFTSKEMERHLGVIPKDKLRILRLSRKIITPARGFHVVVPEEYRMKIRVPVDRYIDILMKYYNRPYYVGLLTAASYWGASPQSPQVFQVITNYDRRNIKIAKSEIAFYRKKGIDNIQVAKRKTATGYFNLATPEITYMDLVYFYKEVGGFDYIVSILFDLIEKMKINELRNILDLYNTPIIQRSAYLMEIMGLDKYCDMYESYLNKKGFIYTFLNPSRELLRVNKYRRWKLFINDTLELDY